MKSKILLQVFMFYILFPSLCMAKGCEKEIEGNLMPQINYGSDFINIDTFL